MRPTSVVLIAVYHFFRALFLIAIAAFLVVGGSLLGAIFGRGLFGSYGGGGLGIMLGALIGAFVLCFAIIAAAASYGVWNLREWGRVLSIALAVVSLALSLPGLLVMGLHLNMFFGTYRLFRIAIDILITWYLMQPQIRALFQQATPAAPPVLQ